MAEKQSDTDACFQVGDPFARGRKHDVFTLCRSRDVQLISNGNEELEADQVEAHEPSLSVSPARFLPRALE
jgi:hypothetical protein